MSKYKRLTNYKGIRKNLSSKTFEASKKIKGKTFSRTFKNIREAVHWRNTFNPFEANDYEKASREKITFNELWTNYEKFHFPSLELSSQGIKRQKIRVFFDELKDRSIYDITPTFLEYIIDRKKKEYKKKVNSKRCNFDKSLDEVKAVLNWHKDNYDYKFSNPVLKRHYVQGKIKNTRAKDKVMTQEQLINFIKAFDNSLYQDFAIVQFFCASRFGEIAGIQLKNVDLENKSLLIKEVVVEDQHKRFLELKEYPKNGHPRVVAISTNFFLRAIQRRLNFVVLHSNFLFHENGNPLSYRRVQYHYNKALKKAGLYPQFSSTHTLRYSMATESRRVMGTLDAAQAITGHHSIKMIEQYAKLPTKLQEETVLKVGNDLESALKKRELNIL